MRSEEWRKGRAIHKAPQYPFIGNSAALSSFDSVLIFQISHFLHTTFFSAQDDEMRRTTISHFSFLIRARLSNAIRGAVRPKG